MIADEIGRGEGANFVIRRDFTAGVDADPTTAALTWFRALLEYERGAYWTFAIVTPGHVAVGASPEAHVSARDGVVTMNPISGTFRHPAGGATAETLTEFLESTKETEELFMVVDEELKMMSAVCSDGGRITGPHLKEMSRLTHTEYVLRGRSRLDPRDILRETMFAPTVTGSPMQNACTVITRHETHAPRLLLRRRGAVHPAPCQPSVAADEPTHDLDAPILIRTAYLVDGRLRVPVGATLVRHSDPYGEVSETHGKAAGVLGAIGAVPRDARRAESADAIDEDAPAPAPAPARRRPGDRGAARLAQRAPRRVLAESAGCRRCRPVRGPISDSWSTPRTASPRCSRTSSATSDSTSRSCRGAPSPTRSSMRPSSSSAGRGPATRATRSSARIRRMREVVARRRERRPAAPRGVPQPPDPRRLARHRPRTARRAAPGTAEVRRRVRDAGIHRLLQHVHGPRRPPAPTRVGEAEIAADPPTGDVYALRGPGFASVQGHLESILSRDGMTTLQRLVAQALTSVAA